MNEHKFTFRFSAERNPLTVPKEYERFANSFISKIMQQLFLGVVSPERESVQRAQFSQTRKMAKCLFSLQGNPALESKQEALARTQQAANDFFLLSYQVMAESDEEFPLAGRNKCLGMVVVPRTKLVILAISQDIIPLKDEELRKNMVTLLHQVNQRTHRWIFELACIPTKAQYLMPRTLSMRISQEAPEEAVSPPTRCVEVALMVALCKAGRFKKFTADETGIMAYGGTLWAAPDGSEAIPHFGRSRRNKKYSVKRPIEIKLTDTLSGWMDIWEPCDQHCKIYQHEMLAIGAAGGSATSFLEPRSEWEPPTTRLVK